MYARRAKRVVDKAAEALPWFSASVETPLRTTGTLMFSVQMAQSKIAVLGFDLVLPVLGCNDGEPGGVGKELMACVNPIGISEPDSSSPSPRRIG